MNGQSFHGTPMSQAKGAFAQPSTCWIVNGAATPRAFWGQVIRPFNSATTATNATSIAMTLIDSITPSLAPVQSASMLFVAVRLVSKWQRSPVSLGSVSGNITLETSNPAGAPRTDAVRMWPALKPSMPA